MVRVASTASAHWVTASSTMQVAGTRWTHRERRPTNHIPCSAAGCPYCPRRGFDVTIWRDSYQAFARFNTGVVSGSGAPVLAFVSSTLDDEEQVIAFVASLR